jgi:arsenite-transporting ATPase
MEKIEPLGRRVAKLTAPIINRVIGLPIPRDEVFDAGEELFAKLQYMRELLSDPERTSVRVVLTLESVVIKEAQRSFTYFHLYGYPTDLVVANRILPDEAGPYFRGWYDAQRRYGPEVERTFHPIPVRRAPHFDREVVGLEMLRELAREVYGDADPTTFFYRGRPYTVRRDDGAYIVSVDLPFTDKEQIHLSRHGDELVIDLGTWRRTLVLPRILVDATSEGARFEESTLMIRFVRPPRASGAASAAAHRKEE